MSDKPHMGKIYDWFRHTIPVARYIEQGYLEPGEGGLGVGIPATLPTKHGERIADLLAEFIAGATTRDHLLIERAFELGRSRTGKPSQGKGLNDFKRLLDAAGGDGSSLRILSGRGSYIYRCNGRHVATPLELPFHGTLIVWRLIGSPTVKWEDGP